MKKNNDKYTSLDWVGALSGIIGALIIASNIGINWIGYIIFLVSSLCYSYLGWKVNRKGLMVMNLFFIVINIIGLIRWF